MASGNKIKIDLRGEKELQKLLSTLPSRVIKKGMRKAQSKAATPILGSWKTRAANDTGLYRRSLKRKQKTYANGRVITVLGPDRNVTGATASGKKKVPANYSHLVEDGHGGPHPAPPHSAAKPAYSENKDKSIEIMKSTLLETLYNEARKK